MEMKAVENRKTNNANKLCTSHFTLSKKLKKCRDAHALKLTPRHSCLLKSALKLVEETHVVLEVETQIANAILKHSDTLNTHTKGKA